MQTETARTRTPVEMLREVFADELNRRDADALMPYWADDVVEEFPTGTVRGKEALRKYFAELFAAIPDFHIEARQIAGDAETAFVRWHVTGTFSGAQWMGLEPTGSRVELDGIDCFTFRDGLVAHNFVAYDQVAFGRQIGMLPAKDSPMDRVMITGMNTRTLLAHRLHIS